MTPKWRIGAAVRRDQYAAGELAQLTHAATHEASEVD